MQNRPRNLHRMQQPKKKIPILPFVMVLAVLVLIILFFWLNKKGKQSTINVNENYGTNVTFTPDQDSLATMQPDSLPPDTLPEIIEPAAPAVETNTPNIQITPRETDNMSAKELQQFSDRYDQALRYFYTENYKEAINIFSDLAAKYPGHSFQVNCQHWIGECYFGLQDYNNALAAFNKVLQYGDTYKTDDALLMIGRCYQKLKDKVNARLYFQRLLNEYPMSEFAGKARKHLSHL